MSDQTVIKNGKKPLSKASKPAAYAYKEFFSNKLTVPPDVLKELEEKDLDHQWLNATQVMRNGGQAFDGWEIYKRQNASSATITGNELLFGQDPSGVIKRDDAILGVRPKAISQAYRAYIQEKSDRQLQRAKTGIAREFKRELKEKLPEASVHEGFEENED